MCKQQAEYGDKRGPAATLRGASAGGSQVWGVQGGWRRRVMEQEVEEEVVEAAGILICSTAHHQFGFWSFFPFTYFVCRSSLAPPSFSPPSFLQFLSLATSLCFFPSSLFSFLPVCCYFDSTFFLSFFLSFFLWHCLPRLSFHFVLI